MVKLAAYMVLGLVIGLYWVIHIEVFGPGAGEVARD